MKQSKQDALLYNFIKCNFESYSNNVSDKLILSLSSDIEYKVNEIAKIARNILLKTKRNYTKPEDINSALSMTFKNVLLVNVDEIKVNEKSCDQLEYQKIVLNVYNISPSITINKLPELNSVNKRVYTKLIKALFDSDEDIFKFSLLIIRQKACLGLTVSTIISTLIERIDQIHEEEFLTRLVKMLENIVHNKSLHISENPLRDLCVSLAFKLLWSPINFNFKLRISQILKSIISCQYLLRYTINKIVVEKLLNEFIHPFLSCFNYSGCLIGLITLDYGSLMLSDEFVSNICSLPQVIIDSQSMKNAVCYLLHKTSIDGSLYKVSYNKLLKLAETFFGADVAILFTNSVCANRSLPCESTASTQNFDNLTTLSSVSITPYFKLQREIDMLLQGNTVDQLNLSNYEIDYDMPPILFRKSTIQTYLSGIRYSMADMGFLVKPIFNNNSNQRIRIRINGIQEQDEEQCVPKVFQSEFYGAFQRCHQYIINSKTIKTSRNKLKTGHSSDRIRCAMYSLFYYL